VLEGRFKAAAASGTTNPDEKVRAMISARKLLIDRGASLFGKRGLQHFRRPAGPETLTQGFGGLLQGRLRRRIVVCFLVLGILGTASAIADIYLPNLFPFLDFAGFSGTYSSTGSVDLSGPFFQSLGSNGRTCGTCHQPNNAFGLSAMDAQLRYFISRGKDPLFAQIDGSTCPTGRINNSLVVNNGLIRIGLTVPPNSTDASAPQYTITAVQDPYGCALTTDSQGMQTVSVYRRPLPTTNLGFLSAVMFDGRESLTFPLNNGQTFAANLNTDLTQQATDATLIHAQAGQAPTTAQLSQIVSFELALNSAQLSDFFAGSLSKGANGGAQYLSTQNYYPGINDSLGGDPEGNAFDPNVFTIYSSFQNSRNPQQASIARGEQIFNTQPLTISDVPGLTTGTQQIMGTCTTCHDNFNVGNHSLPLPLDIGTSHSLTYETDANIIAALQQLNAPALPVFELVCTQGPLAGNTYYTSDPGKALITGQCSDIGRGKGLILRGLPARAPYFHNGVAADLQQVVNFYNQRFQIGLTSQQMRDLINFLQTL
jgi:cytochrome c peroxidase